MSRTSYKSAISRWIHREGVDNQVFYDCDDMKADTVSYKSFSEASPDPRGQDLPAHRELPATEPKKRLLSAYSMYLGYLFSILAGIIFTASNVLVKLVPRLDPWLLLLFRAILQLALMVPVMAYSRASVLGPSEHRIKIYFQGVIGGLLPVAIYFAVRRLPLGDAAAIFFSAPVVTLVLSCIILREHCGIYRILTILLMLAGVILLCRPSVLFKEEEARPLPSAEDAAGISSLAFSGDLSMSSSYYTSFHQLLQYNLLGWPIGVNITKGDGLRELLGDPPRGKGFHGDDHDQQGGHDLHGAAANVPDEVEVVKNVRDPVGLAAAIAVPLLSACLALLTRQCADVHCSVLVFWFGAGALVVSVAGFCTLGNQQISYGVQEWVLTTIIALLGITGNLIMTKALSWLKPGKVMILRSSEIVAAYILQISVFKTVPVWLDLGGALLVLGSVLLIGLEGIIVPRIKWRFF